MKLAYTKASPGDASVLAQLRIDFIMEYRGSQPDEIINNIRREFTSYFEKALLDGSCISFLCKSGDEVVGTGAIVFRLQPGNLQNPSGRYGYVMNMYTKPSFRKNGIGNTILNMLMDEARSLGIKAFELHATPDGEPVYLRNGFQIHNQPTLKKFE